MGYFTDKDLNCPKKAKLMCTAARIKLMKKNMQLKTLRANVSQLKTKVQTLQNLIMHLKLTSKISDECEFILKVGCIAFKILFLMYLFMVACIYLIKRHLFFVYHYFAPTSKHFILCIIMKCKCDYYDI